MTTTTIDSQNLSERLDSATPPRVLDVRTPGEFESAHIAGAYNVPLDLLREHRDEIIKHLDDEVVLVCRSGQRATQAEESLRTAGLTNVHILDGGIMAWESAGFAVNRGTQRWDLERQVRLVAGSIVLTSILGSLAAPKLKWVAGAIGGGLTVAALSNTCAMGMA
ncbi:sulfurtransferase, partial [Mycobacterium sp. ITM-2017-0098]